MRVSDLRNTWLKIVDFCGEEAGEGIRLRNLGTPWQDIAGNDLLFVEWSALGHTMLRLGPRGGGPGQGEGGGEGG